jgi:hypothetical protein
MVHNNGLDFINSNYYSVCLDSDSDNYERIILIYRYSLWFIYPKIMDPLDFLVVPMAEEKVVEILLIYYF